MTAETPARVESWQPSLEEALILACASVGEAGHERVQALVGRGPDWDEVLRLATRHGLRPLLHASLAGNRAVPDALRIGLASHHQANAVRNLRLAGELLELLERLAGEGIQALPFKGPVLAEQAYGGLALREFKDLDIVVRRDDSFRAMTALEAAGYRLVRGSDEDLGGYHRAFLHPERQVLVELHWGFTLDFLTLAIDLEALWARVVVGSLSGRSVPGFSLEDTLLLLCIHGSKHQWLALGWVRDVAGLVASAPDLDWDASLTRARETGTLRMLLLGLGVAAGLLDAPLPGRVRAAVAADPQVSTLVATVSRGLTATAAEPDVPTTYRFYFAMRERWRDRVPLALKLAQLMLRPIPEDRKAVPLPRSLHFLYYLIRPLRAAWGRLIPGSRDPKATRS